MTINSDYSDILRHFVEEEVRFLVAGAYAVIKHSEPYNTKDLDLWVAPSRANLQRAYRALARFGAPLGGVTIEDLLNPDMIYQIGMDPVRIDVMSAVPGLDFESAWEHRGHMIYGAIDVPVLSIEDTIRAKKAAGRPKDLLQAAELERIIAQRSPK